MQKTYAAVHAHTDQGDYAMMVTLTESENALSVFDAISGIEHVNIYTTRKRAQMVVESWNECFVRNGISIWSR